MSRANLKANIVGLFDDWQKRGAGEGYRFLEHLLDSLCFDARMSPPRARRWLTAMLDAQPTEMLKRLSDVADRDRETLDECNGAEAAHAALRQMGVPESEIGAIIAKAEAVAHEHRDAQNAERIEVH